MSHYFENDDTLSRNIVKTKAVIKDEVFYFLTDNGVFSKHGLDYGTRTLLNAIDREKIKGDVLDFGCGYGPIGIYMAKNEKIRVHMIDINRRSLELAKRNATLNSVHVDLYESNLYQNVHGVFDYIISNPPIRVGKKILYQILFDAKKYLRQNGELWIVIHKSQGAKSVFKDLAEHYCVELITKNKGFYVIRSIKN